MDTASLLDTVQEMALSYAPRLLGAILTIILGFWIANIIAKISAKQMRNSKIDASLNHFLQNLMRIALKVMVLISAISMLGVQMTSFIAVIGAAGLAVGLALQGSLANFAGGVLILLFKPFKVGDYIEGASHSGTVNQIQIFNTILKTPDNKTILIPNGSLSNNSITNYSTEPQRRVDLKFSISYEDDIDKVKKLLDKLSSDDKRVLNKPKKQIIVSSLAESSVDISVRLWCNAKDYWDIFFDMQENVKKEFDKAKIKIPYPQREYHMRKD